MSYKIVSIKFSDSKKKSFQLRVSLVMKEKIYEIYGTWKLERGRIKYSYGNCQISGDGFLFFYPPGQIDNKKKVMLSAADFLNGYGWLQSDSGDAYLQAEWAIDTQPGDHTWAAVSVTNSSRP